MSVGVLSATWKTVTESQSHGYRESSGKSNWIESWLIVIGNKELLLMVNVLIGQKLIVECPGLGPGAYTICNIYKGY